MKTCYCCENLLLKENFSVEHIIPNSIGGKLKSNDILCNNCNSILGAEIDDELAKQLNFIMNFFMIERDRGKSQPIIGRTDKGDEYILNGIEIKSRPKISVKKESVSFSGNDEKDLKVYFKGLLKKYPQLNIDEIISKANKGKFYLNTPIKLDLNVGGEKLFRAISKIAVNFFIYNGGERKYISKILPYIFGNINNDQKKIFYHFGFTNKNLIINEQNLYHLIKVIGNNKERILYAYIELFGTLKFIIYLDDDYLGNNIDYQYFYNLLSKSQIYTPIEMNYNRNDILKILNNTDNQYFIKNIQKNIQNTMNIGQKIQSDKIVAKLIQESYEKFFEGERNQSKILTESLIEEFVNDLSLSMAIYLSRNKDNEKTHF